MFQDAGGSPGLGSQTPHQPAPPISLPELWLQPTPPDGKCESSYTGGKVVWGTKLGSDMEATGAAMSAAPGLKPRSQIVTDLRTQPQAAEFELGRVQVRTRA